MLRPKRSRVDRPMVGARRRGAVLSSGCQPAVARRQPSTMVMPSRARRPRRLATRSCLGPVADLEAHLPGRVVAQALQRPLCEDRRRRRREPREHAPRGRLHRLGGQDPAAQPHPRSVLRPGPALPRARQARLQARHGPRPLALSGAARQEAGPERGPAGAVQGRRRAQSAAAREQHRLRLPSWATRSATSPTSRTTRRS